ncbi:MAG TPA: hypothetical protein VI874_04310, partial [Candidatus Norongarragalinales archaeon]|nr:hypothetical protein [Candidatus Norongarragalinales archaeon]
HLTRLCYPCIQKKLEISCAKSPLLGFGDGRFRKRHEPKIKGGAQIRKRATKRIFRLIPPRGPIEKKPFKVAGQKGNPVFASSVGNKAPKGFFCNFRTCTRRKTTSSC